METKDNWWNRGNGHSHVGGGSRFSTALNNASPIETTGRWLVMMHHDALESGISELNDKAGLKNIINTADFADGVVSDDESMGADAIVFDKLGVVITDAAPDQIRSLGAASDAGSAIVAVEPERIVYAMQQERVGGMEQFIPPPFAAPSSRVRSGIVFNNANSLPIEYMQGYRDAVNRLVDTVFLSAGVSTETIEAEVPFAWNESEATWGLQATKVAMSRFSGKGIRIAVLDTGFDFDHPDFIGRKIVGKSFIQDQDTQDGHGHGTHCIGTACGPLQPQQLPRYGVAYQSEIFAGKVLSNRGSGSDGGILAGINWAVTNKCHIISMSLGAPASVGQGYSKIFEKVAQRALKNGTLIIAAAGNESHRPHRPEPVGHPANCPSIMAVGALDQQLGLSFFSNAGINPNGGQVDIAAPGSDILSSWPRPQLYNRISGTSMATPHVAGIAALIAEANPGVRGRELFSLLMQNARRLQWAAQDVGVGLVQAP